MPLCGFNNEMIEGLVQFSNGMFKATLQRARENDISIEEAFEKEVEDMAVFLKKLEDNYQELSEHYSTEQAMDRLSEDVRDKDLPGDEV